MDMPRFIVSDSRIDTAVRSAEKPSKLSLEAKRAKEATELSFAVEDTESEDTVGGSVDQQAVDSSVDQIEAFNSAKHGIGGMTSSTPLLQKMNHRHFGIAELYLQGLSIKKIAEQSGYTPQGIGVVVKQPMFQDYIARQRALRLQGQDELTSQSLARAREIIENNAVLAAQVKVDLLSSDDESIQLRASSDILLLAYGKEGLNPENHNGKSEITVSVRGQAAFKLFMDAAIEAGFVDGSVVEPGTPGLNQTLDTSTLNRNDNDMLTNDTPKSGVSE